MIGHSYPDKHCSTNHVVLSLHENQALLAMHSADSGQLIQYCVASNPSFYDGYLVWDSGQYFIVSEDHGDSAFDALRKAVNSMQTLYLVHADTDHGDGYQLASTEKNAMTHLQHYLNVNDELIEIVRNVGFEELTAEDYVNGVHLDAMHTVSDYYSIIPLEIDAEHE